MIKLNTLKIVELVALYNEASEKPVKSFKDKITAIVRLQEVLDAKNSKVVVGTRGQYEVIPVDIIAASETAPKTDDRVIASVASENPKRGKAAARFDLYKVGMTVEQYVAASVAAGNKAKMARADVKWDVAKLFITLAD